MSAPARSPHDAGPIRMTSRMQGHKWLTLAAMCFGLFLIMLDNTIVNVALPSIQRELDASPSQRGRAPPGPAK